MEQSMGRQESIDGAVGRRCLKTHAPSHLVPWSGGVASGIEGKRRVIVVTRNPLDACVSMYYHALNVPSFAYNGPFGHFAHMYYHGHVEHGSFWQWHKGWWAVHKQKPDNVLWVTFEDLKRDLAAEVTRIAAFLDIPCDAALADAVAAGSTFKVRGATRKCGFAKRWNGRFLWPREAADYAGSQSFFFGPRRTHACTL